MNQDANCTYFPSYRGPVSDFANFSGFVKFWKVHLPISLSAISYGERATADQTVQPTNDPQPAAAMTDGVLGNLKERNGEPRVLEVELTASLNCRVQELDSNGGGEGGSGQAVRVHCTDERRGRRASRRGQCRRNGQGMKITPCNRSGDRRGAGRRGIARQSRRSAFLVRLAM